MESKQIVITKLKNNNLRKLAQLVQDDIIDVNDTIIKPPICYSAETHLRLKDDKEYKEKVFGEAKNLTRLFKDFYPEIKIGDIVFRQKSAKSIIGKIKNLEIERVSKLMVEEARNPKMVRAYKKDLIRKIMTDKRLSKEEIERKIVSIANEDRNKKQIIKDLLFERVDENIKKPDDEENVQEKNKMKQNISDLLDESKMINIEKIEQNLLDESRFSHSTKTAFARILYARLKSDQKIVSGVKYLTSDVEGKDSIQILSPMEIQRKISELEENYGDQLKIESIERLEESPKEWKDPKYNGIYQNRIERLIDTNEFLRVKDLYGMHIVITEIPDSFKHHDEGFMSKLEARNKLKESDNPEYRSYDQDCMDIISRGYMNLLAENGITEEFLNKNPKLKHDFIEKKQNTEIIPDSIKSHDKTNGYRAKHIKFQLKNPLYTLELQIISKYVAINSRGNGTAAHSHRFGKARVVPQLLSGDKSLDKLSEKEVDKVQKELAFLTPKYFQLGFIEENGRTVPVIKEFSLEENCEKFYEDFNDPNNKDLKEQNDFNRITYFASKYGELSRDKSRDE